MLTFLRGLSDHDVSVTQMPCVSQELPLQPVTSVWLLHCGVAVPGSLLRRSSVYVPKMALVKPLRT